MNFKRGTRKKRLDVHVCELSKTSDSNLPKLPPNAIFVTRWKRNFQKLFLVSVYHPLTRFYLRSSAAIAFEKRRHGRSSFWWVIHPYSGLRYYWDLIMSFTFLYMFVTIPYIFSFQRVAKSSGPESWKPVYPACIICIFDIALNFITGISSRDSSEICLDPLLITRRYVKGFFIIDFVSSVPYTWFYRDQIPPPGHNGGNSILLIPECLLLLKIFRIYTLRFYLKQIIADFSFSHAQEKATWLALLMVLIFHWCSCVTHVFPFIMAHLTGDTKEDSDMYFITTGLQKKSNSKIYLMYFHMGMSNFFGSSFIEFRSLGKMDTVIRCILLLLGKGCIIYIIVIVLQLVKSAAEPELKYQQIMHSVKEYIAEKKLPTKLRDRLVLYYEYRFQGSYFKENAISNTLSNHLNQEIVVHSSRGLLDTATIFHYLPRNVIGSLMGILKPVIYLNGDTIYKSESAGDCMYFIVSGTVALFTFNGTEVCHEKDGGHFGEGALILPDRRRLESVIALEVCELLRLNRQDFKRMFPLTSIFYKRLEDVAKERQEQINKLNDHGKEETVAENVLIDLPQDNLENIDEKGDAGSQVPINYNNKNNNDNSNSNNNTNNNNNNNNNNNKIEESDKKEN